MNTLKFGNGEWYGKKDTILAYNDENSNFKPLPFSFDRASSATVINKDGLIETVGSGEPRIDYKDDSKGALLLEPSRSNLIPNSQSVINGWISSSIVTADNQAISPDGTFTSGHITSLGDGSYGSIRKAISVSANSTYTISLFVKKEVSETYYMGVGFVFSGGTTDVGYGIIDAVNGTGYSADPRIPFTIKVDDYETYWRFSFTGTDSGSNSSLNAYIYSTLSKNGTSTELGLGSTRTIWGAQVEQGSYATSYIPTSGGVVTRVAEEGIDGGAGTPIFSNTSAVWFIDLERIGIDTDSNGSAIALRNSSFSQQIRLHFDAPAQYIRFRDGVNGYATISTITGANPNVRKKLALRINGSTLSTFSNGNKIGNDYTAPNAFNLEEIDFSSIGFKIHDMRFYNTALTDQELINLTTI